MSENQKKSVDENQGGLMRVVACLALLCALVAVFFWRVATTDPLWEASRPDARFRQTAEAKPKPEPAPVAPAVKAVSEKRPSGQDRYLAAHLGKEVPYLVMGARRKAILSAYTDDLIIIKFEESDVTLQRKSLSAEQQNLWQ